MTCLIAKPYTSGFSTLHAQISTLYGIFRKSPRTVHKNSVESYRINSEEIGRPFHWKSGVGTLYLQGENTVLGLQADLLQKTTTAMEYTEKDLPKIDLPEDWVVGTGISRELLSLYAHYPVRLKCEIFVLCLSGEVDALVNLNQIEVRPYDVITLTPGSIFQISEIRGDLQIYFLGFSAGFMDRSGQSRSMLDTIFLTLGRPVITLKPEGARMLEKYLQMLIDMYEHFSEKIRQEIATNLYADIQKGISLIYQTRQHDKTDTPSKSVQPP